jgi:hypothetical protein
MSTREVSDEEVSDARLSAILNRTDERWWLYKRELPDGRVIYLAPIGFGNRLGISRDSQACEYDDVWDYPYDHTLDGGWRAALGWDGNDEPEGWYRHVPTGRRRKGGDPAKEYFLP